MSQNISNNSGLDHDQDNSRRELRNYKDLSNPGDISSYLSNVGNNETPKNDSLEYNHNINSPNHNSMITPDNKNYIVDANFIKPDNALKNQFLFEIEQFVKSRKHIHVSGWQIFKIMYCSCCMSKKEKIINSTLEYIEKASEIGNFLKTSRELVTFEKLDLEEDQRKIKIFASINLNNEAEEDEDKGEDFANYMIKLNEACDTLKTIDLRNRENRMLAEVLIGSIV